MFSNYPSHSSHLVIHPISHGRHSLVAPNTLSQNFMCAQRLNKFGDSRIAARFLPRISLPSTISVLGCLSLCNSSVVKKLLIYERYSNSLVEVPFCLQFTVILFLGEFQQHFLQFSNPRKTQTDQQGGWGWRGDKKQFCSKAAPILSSKTIKEQISNRFGCIKR